MNSHSPDDAPQSGIDRRTVLRGAGALCLGAAGACLVAACAPVPENTSGPATATSAGTASSTAPQAAPTSSGTASTGTGTAAGAVPAGTPVGASSIPVGGGVILSAEKIVVTQPAAGTYKAFSAVCPHQGYLVGAVQGTINCLHHGSQFDLSTGARTAGPAPTGLTERSAVVSGDTVYVA